MAFHLILFGLFSATALYFTVLAQLLSDPSSCENGTQNVNCVFPNISCGMIVQHPCLTLNDYANNVDTYFVNDSTFLFIPGNHQLSVGLSISSVHNLSLAGLSENSVTIEILNESEFFACESCMNVSIANITFALGGTFSCILSFEHTYFVKLSNITILGNRHIGCSSVISENSIVDISNSIFTGIRGYCGAALMASKSTIAFAGNNSFVNNEALAGGALFLYNCSSVSFNGTNFFSKNSAIKIRTSYNDITRKCSATYRTFTENRYWFLSKGGAIYSYYSNIASIDYFMYKIDGFRSPCLSYHIDSSLQLSSHIIFLNNSAASLGGAIYLNDSELIIDGSICFVKNHAESFGGALFSKKSYIAFNINKLSNKTFIGPYIMFMNNSVKTSGGAIFLSFSTMHVCSNVSSIKSNTMIRGNSLFLTISFILMNNRANSRGGAIFLTESTVEMCGNISFVNNNANSGGAVHTKTSYFAIGVDCRAAHDWSTTIIVFQQNTASYSGGSISSIDSLLYFMGSALFDSNTAGYGGAMIMDGTSNLNLEQNLTLNLINNRANEKGGVFYYDHSVSTSCEHFSVYVLLDHHLQCFISFKNTFESTTFRNNSASKAGSVLYSGKLGICYRYSGKKSILEGCTAKIGQDYCSNLHWMFANESNFIETKELFFADTEDVKVCHFQQNFLSFEYVLVYPGEKFNVSLIAKGAFNFPVSTRILHKMLFPTNEKIELRRADLLTKVNSSCTNVSYFLLVPNITNQPMLHFKLYHQNPCDSLANGVNLYIDIKPCPFGFQLLTEYKKCTCDKLLLKFGITKCNIDNLSVEREKNTFWVSKLANNSGLMLHNGRCPFDFCKAQSVNVSLTNPSVQCNFKRRGTLCGQCREQFSLALGTLHCLNCTNNYSIALIIPFALAGIALVMVILLLHLTVDVGTLNGLIFYANIVQSNREAYFQHTSESTDFHTIFIAWLNLDLGIESCFYDGMDIYAYSWLQFLFPFYIWFLIGTIIFICRYSQRLSNSLGRNPVAVLGTVLFLSYGKILNAIVAPLSKTELMFSLNDESFSTHSVWLYDGSVKYFSDPKHIALGLFAILILLVAFVPYTFILFCGHWLIAYSDKCFLSWLNKIKPVLDVYYAPFKQEARYWIGLTLLARSALLLTIAINAVGSDSVNLLVIASVTAGLLSINGRVYECRCNDILESSFILNLCVLSVATFYLKDKDIGSQPAIFNTSVGISFVIFIGILFFHIFLSLKSKNDWKNDIVVNSLLHKNWLLCKLFKMVPKEDETKTPNSNDPKVVTSTLVELREPLIDNDEV